MLIALVGDAVASEPPIRIGVLSHRGSEATLKMWSPTADYLTNAVHGRRFEVVPLDFVEVNPSIESGDVDFVLVNPGIYVNLEVRYRVSRIATLNNLVGEVASNVFGGVIFTRMDRDDLSSLLDLQGQRFLAVDETSLGGFQMAWRQFQDAGLNPYEDFTSLLFKGIHDDVVMAVLNGEADAGTVRTDILERMVSSGTIDLNDFKILNAKFEEDFYFNLSTRLYPEWPFSKVQHTPNELAQQIAVALLNMPANHVAAQAGNYAGWTIPLDYQPVHEIFQALSLPPYESLAKFTLMDAIRKYWYWLLGGLIFLLSMAFMTTWVARLNRELKRAQLHLEQRHELILNSVADGIYGVDLQGNSTFVNRAMELITGWKAEELIGQNQHDILHHTHADGTPHPRHECPVYATYRDNVPRFVDDDVFWKKDGTSFPVEYTSTPLRDEHEGVVGSVVVFRDISEQKLAEEEARQHQMDLAHVARLSTMGEMASGIAHEINQPLTAIATNAHACIRMLESGGEKNERIADAIERIGTQAERAGEIIRQLRQFVRKEQPQLTDVNLNELINEVVVLIKPEALKANVRIDLDLDEDIGSVRAQHIQIDQVILNLARNAIEAMMDTTDGDRILAIMTRKGGRNAVIVTVSDTGPGLSEEVKEQVFNPFVTTKPSGMGLGLSISQGIIDAHKGRLYVDSESGQGAVFRFMLPVTKGDKGDETYEQ
ncbi:PhnD/SsuA/transferrin family substrate-binding protein [Solemya velesiana gill symbiont]|uniref:PhnD/SsuA/transferrin family substrate-binding protein n=1 Tax=Solemya velesiana gill symbiont TaxID=1918948 RepID=UPI001FE2F461|nr:PhnD/SsuA/transferrin family substrate-binding protein [Solemya velesiana gill symbiont]